jgi:hypothetical protein
MADPEKYIPDFSFTGSAASNPSNPIPAVPLDTQLQGVSDVTEQIVEALKDVRRPDGGLKNAIVKRETLNGDVTDFLEAKETAAANSATAADQRAAAALASANASASAADTSVTAKNTAVAVKDQVEIYYGQVIDVGENMPAVLAVNGLAAQVAADRTQTGLNVSAAQLAKDGALAAAGPLFTNEAAGRAAVADGQPFRVLGSDNVSVRQFTRLNSSTSVEGESVPSLKALRSVTSDQAKQDYTLGEIVQRIGRPVDPISGTSIGNSVYVFAQTAAQATELLALTYFGMGTGVGYVKVFNKSGDVFSRSGIDYAFSVVPGLNTAVIRVPVVAGQYVGVFAPALLAVSDATQADGGGFFDAGVGAGNVNTFTDAAVSTGTRLQFAIEFLKSYVNTNKLKAVEQEVNGSAATLSVLLEGENTTSFGNSNPVTGTGIGTRTYAYALPVGAVNKQVVGVSVFALQAGTIILKAFNRSGNTLTQVGNDVPVAVQPGLQTIKLANRISLNSDQLLGFYGPGIVAINSGTTGTAYFDSSVTGSGNLSTFEVGASSTFVRLNLTFLLADRPNLLARSQDHEARLATLEDVLDPTVREYVLVWALGQSNFAGRGLTKSGAILPVGSAYKFVRSSGLLAHLEDPTGNDGISLSDGGKGSFGPAFAKRILDRYGVGVILINSALGGTTVAGNWGPAGNAWTQAQADWTAALTRVLAMKLNIAGTAVLFGQGESDGDSATTKAAYKTAALDLFSRVGAVTGLNAKQTFVLAQTGAQKTSDPAAYQTIRQAQAELVRESSNIFLGWNGAKWLGDANRAMMIDAFHYTTAAYEEMGAALAHAAIVRGMGLLPSGLD